MSTAPKHEIITGADAAALQRALKSGVHGTAARRAARRMGATTPTAVEAKAELLHRNASFLRGIHRNLENGAYDEDPARGRADAVGFNIVMGTTMVDALLLILDAVSIREIGFAYPWVGVCNSTQCAGVKRFAEKDLHTGRYLCMVCRAPLEQLTKDKSTKKKAYRRTTIADLIIEQNNMISGIEDTPDDKGEPGLIPMLQTALGMINDIGSNQEAFTTEIPGQGAVHDPRKWWGEEEFNTAVPLWTPGKSYQRQDSKIAVFESFQGNPAYPIFYHADLKGSESGPHVWHFATGAVFTTSELRTQWAPWGITQNNHNSEDFRTGISAEEEQEFEADEAAFADSIPRHREPSS